MPLHLPSPVALPWEKVPDRADEGLCTNARGNGVTP
jgi:hypothetical protein